jgi:hypothetical protein
MNPIVRAAGKTVSDDLPRPGRCPDGGDFPSHASDNAEARSVRMTVVSYMLDANTMSSVLKDQGRVAQRLLSLKPPAISVSAITLAELRYGAEKASPRSFIP